MIRTSNLAAELPLQPSLSLRREPNEGLAHEHTLSDRPIIFYTKRGDGGAPFTRRCPGSLRLCTLYSRQRHSQILRVPIKLPNDLPILPSFGPSPSNCWLTNFPILWVYFNMKLFSSLIIINLMLIILLICSFFYWTIPCWKMFGWLQALAGQVLGEQLALMNSRITFVVFMVTLI